MDNLTPHPDPEDHHTYWMPFAIAIREEGLPISILATGTPVAKGSSQHAAGVVTIAFPGGHRLAEARRACRDTRAQQLFRAHFGDRQVAIVPEVE